MKPIVKEIICLSVLYITMLLAGLFIYLTYMNSLFYIPGYILLALSLTFSIRKSIILIDQSFTVTKKLNLIYILILVLGLILTFMLQQLNLWLNFIVLAPYAANIFLLVLINKKVSFSDVKLEIVNQNPKRYQKLITYFISVAIFVGFLVSYEANLLGNILVLLGLIVLLIIDIIIIILYYQYAYQNAKVKWVVFISLLGMLLGISLMYSNSPIIWYGLFITLFTNTLLETVIYWNLYAPSKIMVTE